MKRFFLLMILLLPCFAIGQVLVQNVRGIVIDKVTKKPLAGATVTTGTSIKVFAISDSVGVFVLKNVPVGRQIINASYVGYAPHSSDNIIISAAKQTGITIELEEDKTKGHEVIVTGIRNPKLPENPYAIVSGRSFSPEETQRYAASANDPSRMALAFPGVQATRDTRSDIIIRGNNPMGMQWRMEGVDIPNPNHFARRGSSGGGITIFSLSMLANSDFLTGAMPAEYGDVLSGVFDMHLRKGNNQKAEHTLKAGMIGLDYATEGPIQKGRSSYLVNYRYSTLGLLNSLGFNLVGERESNTFQDLAFNIAFNNKKNTSQWNFWGIGGISKENQRAVENVNDWKQYDDYAIYDFRTKMGALGIGHQLTLNERSFVSTSLVATGQQVLFADDTLNPRLQAARINDENYNNSRISFTSSYNYKFGAAANMKAGFYANNLHFSFRQRKFDFLFWSYRNMVLGNGSTWLVQPYWQMSLKPGSRFTINPGIHMMYFGLNKKTTIDPRLTVQFRLKSNESFSIAYGLHSKILPLGSYFFKDNPSNPNPNINLDMMRSHHFVAAYDHLFPKGWRFHAEAYYQRLFKVPVVNEVNRTYWLLNDLEGYAKEQLVSKGKGTNVGIDLSAEKFFSKGFFLIGSFSIFNSTYQPLDGRTYNTRFNSNTSGSFTGAKEWKLKNNKTLQAGWKMLYNGGLPLTPLAAFPSTSREPVLDETRPYTEKVPAYFRTDGRLALRKEKTKVAWQLALDIQNVFGTRNIDGLARRYDPSVNQWIFRQQAGLVPVLSYQIDF
ncbi:TonB-dependent receptor [Aridibaculum aurantiacum]|uniref:TonB-dependent receptor n=1 Tax=Aridibaculum aurantiacum TaxID=2810307 RepID=UPI001A96560B|nr:TonB-dependent receptor [Aridibaculum aurantiacum]